MTAFATLACTAIIWSAPHNSIIRATTGRGAASPPSVPPATSGRVPFGICGCCQFTLEADPRMGGIFLGV